MEWNRQTLSQEIGAKKRVKCENRTHHKEQKNYVRSRHSNGLLYFMWHNSSLQLRQSVCTCTYICMMTRVLPLFSMDLDLSFLYLSLYVHVIVAFTLCIRACARACACACSCGVCVCVKL